MKTGLVTASQLPMRSRGLGDGRNPLKTGLVTASGWALVFEALRAVVKCRNPLKTGLVTASRLYEVRLEPSGPRVAIP